MTRLIASNDITDAVIALERDLLGTLASRPEVYDDCDDLDPADFAIPEHGIIYREISEAIRTGRGISPTLIAASVGVREIAGLTPGQYLMRILANAPPMTAVPDLVRSVRDAADRRRITEAARIAQEQVLAASWSRSPADIAADVIASLDIIVSSRASRTTRRMSLSEAAGAALDGVNDRRGMGRRLAGCTWGLRDMDEATMGLIPGDVIILAGRPSMGKSAVACSTALSAATSGVGVMFVSLEMTAEQLALRALTDEAWSSSSPIAYADVNRNDVSDDDMHRLLEAGQRLQGLPFIIDQQPGLAISQVATRARRAAKQFEARGQKLGLLVIDHMGLIKASSRYAGNKVAEVGEVSNALKPLAKELGVAVLALCQLSRQTEQREDKRPQLSDLRWAGEIEQDADVVVGVYREAYYLERKDRSAEEAARLHQVENEIDLVILKQRMGPTRTVTAYCDIKANVVRNREWRA